MYCILGLCGVSLTWQKVSKFIVLDPSEELGGTLTKPVCKGGFTLGSTTKETPRLSDLIGRENVYGSKEFMLAARSKV